MAIEYDKFGNPIATPTAATGSVVIDPVTGRQFTVGSAMDTSLDTTQAYQRAISMPTPQYASLFNPTLQPINVTNLLPPATDNIKPSGVAQTIAPATIPGGTGDIVSNLPAPLGSTSGQSRIDPALLPYLQLALQRSQQLFLGSPQPSLYPGQMYVSPSAQTEQALQLQEQLASAAAPVLTAGQQAYLQSMGQLGQTAAGGFLGGSPYREALIQAATRPLVQQYAQEVVPGIASGFSKAGRYGSGAMEQAQARAAESFGRSLGDVAASVAAQDYARERGLQQQAQLSQAALGQAAPSFFQASFLPTQALAQVGAAREQIAAQPLQEAMQRYQYSQQLPYQQLQGFLSSVYGTPMASSQYQPIPQTQTNRLGSALGGAGLGYLGGQLLTSQFGANAPLYGAAGGALLGGLL